MWSMGIEVFHIHSYSMRSRDAIDFQSSSDLSRLMLDDGISAALAIQLTSRIVRFVVGVANIGIITCQCIHGRTAREFTATQRR